jgi:hypothetical protein
MVNLPTVDGTIDVLILLGITLELPNAKDGNESSPGSVGDSSTSIGAAVISVR